MTIDHNKYRSRREFIEALMKTVAATGAWTLTSSPTKAGVVSSVFPDSSREDMDSTFPQGIASGDPRPDGMLIWTRIAADSKVQVAFQIAEDVAFEKIVRDGMVTAVPDSDFTVRVRMEGLEPNRRYWYRFRAGEVSSPIGRTRTAPSPDQDVPVTVAFASCQDYQGRWYHAWNALAERADTIDFVLFLGDYIYEYERFPQLQEPQPGRAIEMPDGLVIDEAGGVVAAETLNDYREIYRVTRTDKDLRRIHQLCPFVILWDDHEHANDAWQDHAVDFNDRRGDEKDTARRESATRAWFEYLPVDLHFDPTQGFPNDIVTWRKFRWGRHAEFCLTDERYYRDDHVVPEGPVDRDVGKFLPFSLIGSRTLCIKEPFEEREAAAQPTMLGTKQRDWLTESLRHSTATWKIWASGLMVSQFVLDLRPFEKLPPLFRNVFYFKTDQWDGFLSERKHILKELSNVENLVVLSGDLHGFYASHLHADFDNPADTPIGIEFTVAGISSISLAEQIEAVTTQPLLAATGLPAVVKELDPTLLKSSPHFAHADSRGYGVGIARFTAQDMDVEFLSITGIREPDWNGEVVSQSFHVSSGQARIEPESVEGE